ncbi:hypothetical protein E2C01_092200 [Portunus trituberculatus]|uniref:Uncharacterized protein n=1 Tax=Portunus trituberculatus TaxID=210409 RepID=A0A5B7JPY8_PORTR|nr:hypothetical protein [Portunus trituberculatus]
MLNQQTFVGAGWCGIASPPLSPVLSTILVLHLVPLEDDITQPGVASPAPVPFRTLLEQHCLCSVPVSQVGLQVQAVLGVCSITGCVTELF